MRYSLALYKSSIYIGTKKVHVGWHPISRKYSDFIEPRRELSAVHYDMGMSSAFTIESPLQALEAYFGVRLLAIKKEVIKFPSPQKEKFPLSHLLSPVALIEFQICPEPDR